MLETEVEVKNAALMLLARREHSRKELAQKLRRRCNAECIEAALDQLEADGYLSDQRFTESFVRMRVAQGHGLKRISYDLKQKGVSTLLLEQVLECEPVDWYLLAEEVCKRKYPGASSDDYKVQAKQLRYLMQRGFSMDEARHALKQKNFASDG